MNFFVWPSADMCPLEELFQLVWSAVSFAFDMPALVPSACPCAPWWPLPEQHYKNPCNITHIWVGVFCIQHLCDQGITMQLMNIVKLSSALVTVPFSFIRNCCMKVPELFVTNLNSCLVIFMLTLFKMFYIKEC